MKKVIFVIAGVGVAAYAISELKDEEKRKAAIEYVKKNAVSFAAVAVGIISIARCAEIGSSLQETIKAVKDGVEVDIPEVVVSQAVDNAAKNAVSKTIGRVSSRIEEDAKNKIAEAVRRQTSVEVAKVSPQIKKKLEREISNLDIDELKRDVMESASESLKEKLDDSLDDILEDYNDNLKNIGKIYQSIANTMIK